LPGVIGDESWRKAAVKTHVTLDEDGRGGQSCRTRASGGLFWGACAEDEIALQPRPTGWLTKYLMVWFPYPIIPELDGTDLMPCMD
jgi:hypothetical protein